MHLVASVCLFVCALLESLNYFVCVCNQGAYADTLAAFNFSTLGHTHCILRLTIPPMSWNQARQEKNTDHSAFFSFPLQHDKIFPASIYFSAKNMLKMSKSK